jgi:hypothetical protein
VVHTVVGSPTELEPSHDRERLVAAMRSYSAAAACSTLTARLLMAEGIDLQAAVDAIQPVYGHDEPAASGAGSAWRSNVLASAAAIAELEAAKSAWQSVELPSAGQVVAMIETLLSYGTELTDVLDADKPASRN